MVVRGALLVVLAAVGVASAEPKPRPVDIKPFRDKLVVLEDASGGIYVVANERGDEPHVFFGTTKVLHEVVYDGSRSRDGDAWSVAINAPRVGEPFMAFIARKKDGTYRRSCGTDKHTELTEITGNRAKQILDKAAFLTTQVTRRPYLLARDNRGVYYYVDVLRNQYGGNGHRVFVGKKGALKQLPLVDVASDTAGDVFSTKSGDLRLVRNREESDGVIKTTAEWIRGERTQTLIHLNVYMNQALIFRDLGLYKFAGTICGTY